MLRSALSSLSEPRPTRSSVRRWKNIIERLENAIGSCNHAARVLEGIRIKNGL
jgi:hypothetical protein